MTGFKNRIILLALFLLAATLIFLLKTGIPEKSPHIILISIDTLRADHLGYTGYQRDTSPSLDRFSETACCFESCFSQSPSTTPSHLSIFSSLYTLSHGIRANDPDLGFSDKIILLQEILRKNGYRTAAFTGNGWISKIFGFSRGFDHWSEKYRNIRQHLPEVKQWIHFNKDTPFFLFFHFYDVHAPYRYRKQYLSMYRDPALFNEVEAFTIKVNRARRDQLDLPAFFNMLSGREKGIAVLYSFTRELLPGVLLAGNRNRDLERNQEAFNHFLERDWPKIPGYRDQLQFLVDSYDAGIRETDRYIGLFFAFLKESGLWKNSLIIVTSDHGEEFMEHNRLGHEKDLYDTLLQVPLLIKLPGKKTVRGRHIAQIIELVDIMPTILDLLKIDPPAQAQGKSLLGLIRGRSSSHKQQVFASVSNRENQSAPRSMVRNRHFKCIMPAGSEPEDAIFSTTGTGYGQELPVLSIPSGEKYSLWNSLQSHRKTCLKLYHLMYARNRPPINGHKKENQQSGKVKQNLKTLGYLD